MRQAAPTLLPILRSRVQGDLLALTYLHPDSEYSLSDAARRIGSDRKVVLQEANRLVAAGLLAERRSGRARLVRANSAGPLLRPLTELLALTYGPLPVLTEVLSEVEGIVAAYIYGSWAARYEGEPGPPPRDVDVLVVGTASLDDLDAAADRAETVLRREVSIRRIPRKTWDQPTEGDAFLKTVKSRPLVVLRLAGGECTDVSLESGSR